MEYFLPFVLFSIVSTITPGPNNIMLLASGLNFGIKRSLPHMFGICFGFPVMVLAIGLGIAGLFNQFPLLHQLLKVASIIYLAYLACKIAMTKTDMQGNEHSNPMSFLQAASFQWVNPKAWFMSIGAVATYTSPEGNFLLEIILISLIFLLVFLPFGGVWLFFGAWLKRYLTTQKAQKKFNYLMAALLFASIGFVLFN